MNVTKGEMVTGYILLIWSQTINICLFLSCFSIKLDKNVVILLMISPNHELGMGGLFI